MTEFDDQTVPATGARDITWTPGRLSLLFTAAPDRPVVLTGLGAVETVSSAGTTQPLVELMITGDGRAWNNTRFTNTGVGSRLRYVRHEESSEPDVERLAIVQRDDSTGLTVTSAFEAGTGATAVRVRTTVQNDGPEAVVLEAVSSLALGAVVYASEAARDLLLYSARGEHLAEYRWRAQPLFGPAGLGYLDDGSHAPATRGAIAAISTSTWTTAYALPTGVIENSVTGRSLAWQIEHNGGWRWELVNVRGGEDAVALVLVGPEDLDHHWSEELVPGAQFTTVPASIAVSGAGFGGAVAELTRHRRWLRRERTADAGSLLVFNDYMNTLNGDPTTERLLPLIEAAAQTGAECFCIDAGWYDDTELGNWWPSVGEWLPSSRRFPDGGLPRVLDVIRATGMRAGLWVEPEVVGVRSRVAETLPAAAFLQRHGRRVTEHERFFLDLRHPAARAHLDATFDRLITDLGIGYFKLDYNVTPGAGTDLDAFSVGAGLLAHNRAHLAWLADLRRRHPQVILENCSSGGMRADFAMLETLDIQSTSDQEDFRLYAPIAASAPVLILPEQAGNWAYPQAWMQPEEIAYTMVTGLSGRLYLSGFLDRMNADQRQLVTDATALFKQRRADIAESVPGWPLGLPGWSAEGCALTLSTPERTLLYLWHRGGEDAELTLGLPAGIRAGHLVERYPGRLAPWTVADSADGVVLRPGIFGPSARVYEWAAPA